MCCRRDLETAALTGVYARLPLTCGYLDQLCIGSGNATTYNARSGAFRAVNDRGSKRRCDIVGLYLNLRIVRWCCASMRRAISRL